MTIYPPEILNFSIRSNGYVMPIGLKTLGWKMYVINASWDVVTFFLILFFWVETKGKSLEEIDEIFDGKKHSDAPDLAQVMDGTVQVDVVAMEKQMRGEIDEKADGVDISVLAA